jgi:hypothetical protein
VLLAVPLTTEIESPYIAKTDEETWEDEEEDAEDAAESDEEAEDGDEAEDEGEAEPGEEDEEEAEDEEPAAVEDDGVSGTWEGTVSGPDLPPGLEFTMPLWLEPDHHRAHGKRFH